MPRTKAKQLQVAKSHNAKLWQMAKNGVVTRDAICSKFNIRPKYLIRWWDNIAKHKLEMPKLHPPKDKAKVKSGKERGKIHVDTVKYQPIPRDYDWYDLRVMPETYRELESGEWIVMLR